MAQPLSIAELLKLSVAERIQLVEDIWESIAAVPDSVPLTEAQKQELDRRLESYHRNPSEGSPWEEVAPRLPRETGRSPQGVWE